jgi:hypothetical protein
MTAHSRLSLVVGLALTLLVSQAALSQQPSGHWIAGADMAHARAGAAASLLPDGRVLLSGGEGATGVQTDAELLVDGLLFAPASAMNVARRDHVAAVLLDGRVLVAGGTTTGGAATSSAELYDPATDTWTLVGGLSEARSGAAATRLQDGRILVAGGESGGVALTSLEIFDAFTGAFSTSAAALSSGRIDHAAALLGDGRVLVAGGSDGVGVLATSDVYDPDSDAMSAGPTMSAPRAGVSATSLLDGTVLVAGGSDANGELDTAEICDASASGFFPTPTHLAVARRDHLALALPGNGSVLIAGGQAGAVVLSSAELYRPWSGDFAPAEPLSQARLGAAAAPLAEGVALVAGGVGLSSSELFGFATVRTDKLDYAPGEVVTISGAGWEPGEAVSLRLVEVPFSHEETLLTAIADPSGGILNQEFAPEHHDIGVQFFLIASGSQAEAGATFSDSPKVGAVTVGAQSATPIYGTSSAATYPVTVFRGTGSGSSGNFTATLSLTTSLPPGVTATFSPNPVQLTPALNSATSTLTITSATCTVPGSTAYTAKAETSASDFATVNNAFAVNPRPLTVNVDPKSRNYGDANPALSATLGGSGLAAGCGDTLADVGALSTAATACSATGNYPISFTASGAKAANYLVTVNGANLTVDPRPITVSPAAISRVYGNANPALTASVGGSGLATGCGDTLADVGTVSTAATQCSGVGTYPIGFTANGAKAGNYSVTVNAANLTVQSRSITVTATAATRVYGDANPAFNATVGGSGLAAACGDTLADVGALSTAATQCSNHGVFPITFSASGPKAGNYSVAYTGANLTINRRPLSVTADALSRMYGDPNSALTAQLGGSGLAVACGDTLADVGTLSTAATACSALGSYPISFAAGGPKAAEYDVTFTAANLTVVKRTISIAADPQSRIYGSSSLGLTAQISGSGLAATCGDTLADIGHLANAATTCSAVGSYPITFVASGTKVGNYDVTTVGSALTVQARPITVAADGQSRFYGDTNAALSAQVGGSGLAAACGDELADVGTLSTAATQCSAVGAYPIGFLANGPQAGNYGVSFTGADVTVTERPLSVTADAKSRIYGDVNPALTAQLGGSGLASACGDTLADVGALSTAATQCSAVGTFAIAFGASGPKAGNYNVSFTGADLTVTARPLSVTADAKSRIYGDANPALTAQLGGSGLASACGDTLTDVGALSTAATQCSPVGTFAISFGASGPKAGNYNVSFTGADLTVQVRPLSVTADAKSRIYGDANPALTAQLGGSGLASACGDTLADVGALSTAATQCSAVGSYPIAFTASGPKAGNYDVSSTDSDLTVQARPLSVTADPQSRIYGDANPALTAQPGGSGLASACGDTLADVGALSTAATQCSAVGTFAIAFSTSGPKAGNYDVSFTGADLTVAARPLSVTADAQSRAYGDANPALTAQLGGSGLASACGDTLADVGALSTAATQCSAVGTFAIAFSASGPKAGNYDVSFTGADLTVAARPLSVTADAKSRIYGDANPGLTAQLGGSGLASACGDTLADVGALATAVTQCSAVGNYPITFSASGPKAGNYAVSFGGANLTVTTRPLSVTADPKSRTYGEANPALTAQLGGSGLASSCGDTLADVGALSTSATQCSAVGNYAIAFSASGPKAGNYGVSFGAANLTVSARPLTVTPDAQSRLYGEPNSALTAQLGGSGLASSCGDTLTDVGVLSTAASQCSAVGNYVIGFSAIGPKAGNYQLTVGAASLSILARPISVTADAKFRVYGNANPALTAQLGGNGLAAACGDTLADVGALSTSATACSAVGGYPIAFAASGPKAGNYAVTATGSSLTVDPRPISVTAEAKTRVYGNANPTLTALIGGSGLAASCADTLADVGALSTTATQCSVVGTYPIAFDATGPKAGNYAVSTSGALLTVTKRGLSIAAGNVTLVLAAPLPTFTATYSGFTCGDGPASLDTPVTFTPAITPGVVGTYPIVPAGATDANYDISFAPGVLTVAYASVGGSCSMGPGHKILQPINADGSSVCKRGSSVPAKFRVYDANCNSIGTPGVISSFVLYQVTAGTVVTDVNEPVDATTPTNEFKWDPSDQQWIFVISTKGAGYQAGKTYHYRITLNDGSTIEFQFGLK